MTADEWIERLRNGVLGGRNDEAEEAVRAL